MLHGRLLPLRIPPARSTLDAKVAAMAPTMVHRLHRPADIRAVFTARAVAHGSSLVVHAAGRPDVLPARWTVVAGGKVGDAVRRNRAKRRLRAAVGRLDLPAGVDFVLVARSNAVTAPYAELEAEVDRLVCKAAGLPAVAAGLGRAS